jgi:2-keto-4-pentenoate hydratase/2-oxohepta-3-ene-1,7-dioic acid hydratase in catechol pathway
VDWEAELVAVIGRRARRIAAGSEWDYVAGLTVGQDLSERRVQFAAPPAQFSLAKSFENFSPVGPWLVTADEFDDPTDIEVRCLLNGDLVQRDRVSSMIHSIPELVRKLSNVVELTPGDLIFTGTPAGVGMAMEPPRYLRPATT